MPRGFNRAYLDRLKSSLPLSFVIAQTTVLGMRSNVFEEMVTEDYFVARRGIQLLPQRKLGKNPGRYACLSPFSSEKTPSMMVRDDEGFYKCFSTQKGGDVFTFLMEMTHASFPEAVALVRELDAGGGIRERVPRQKRRPKISRNQKRRMKKGGP
jgi:hypothetical protein